MTRPITKWQWMRLAGAVLLCGGVAAAFRWWPPALPADAAFAALQAEQAELRSNDDSTRTRLAAERDQLAQRVGLVPLAELQKRLDPNWTWQSHGGGRWLVSLNGAQPDGWLDLLAGVAELERQPGVFIEEVELHGDGRNFTQALVTIRVRGQGGETQPGLGTRPAPVSAPNGPAKAPAVGRVRSLRRPGALRCIRPPSGPALARSLPSRQPARAGSQLT